VHGRPRFLTARLVGQQEAEPVARDWLEWHRGYETTPDRAKRLELVRREIADALDRAVAGPFRAVSICAGDGRDLLGVLARHTRAVDVRARLVELDPSLAGNAREAATKLGLTGVEVLTTDAGSSGAYVGAVPADLVLLCGVFGNISDVDVRTTIDALPQLCARGATVIWTRHRRPPDLTGPIRRWMADAGLEEVGFQGIPGGVASVGVHRFVGRPVPLIPGQAWFRFRP
jgi:hypothetical protein